MPATDRELIELAAKAAGIYIDKSPYNGGGHGNTGFDILGNAVLSWRNNETWNPLTDDGDAFRLAVKLKIRASVTEAWACCDWWAADGITMLDCQEPIAGSPCAATRRAIVRAAAAMAPTSAGG